MSLMPLPPYRWGKSLGTKRTEGCVNPTARPDTLEKRKTGIEPRSLERPTRSLVTIPTELSSVFGISLNCN
jgi:hypothetical protein